MGRPAKIKDPKLSKREMYLGNPNLPSSEARFEYTPEMVMEIEKCKNDMLYFAENYFYIIDPDIGKVKIQLYDFQKRIINGFKSHRFNALVSPRQASKALALDTPIPTPNGWTTMGELKDGDVVYGRDGNPCNVLMAHDTRYNRPCYEVIFDNGEIIVADGDHNWFVQDKNQRSLIKECKGSVKTTKELINNFKTKDGEPFYRIPSCIDGIFKEKKDLLIDPYILGIWLGDGHTNGSRITVGRQYIDELTEELSTFNKYRLSSKYQEKRKIYSLNLCKIHRKKGSKGNAPSLHMELNQLGIMGNKHIPEIYFESSREQRLELLMGLMDSDGTIDKKGMAIFNNSDLNLALQVKSLIESLGYKTTYKVNRSYLYGKRCKDSASVSFCPREYVCKLSFKKERIKISDINYPESNKRNQWHYIKDIRTIDSVPVRCITVDSKDSLFLCGKTYIPTHNTTMMTVAALHEACFKDYRVIIIVANKESTAMEIFRRVRLAYEELPTWLKPAVKEYGKTGCEFANGSRISISTTTGSAGRGGSVNLLVCDEIGWVDNHLAEEYWKSVYPTISRAKTSKIIVASTPNGKGNLFHRLYTEAEKGENGFNALRIEWDEIPGRDEKWKQEQIKALGSLESFLQEFGNVFLDNGESALDEVLFDELKKQCTEPRHLLDEGHYKIWEDPDASRLYVAGVDVAEGVGGDASVIQILDITDLRDIQQVAEYHNNQIAPAEFSNKLHDILLNWGSPLVLIERNNQGGQVCDRLAIDFGYEKVVSWGAKKANRMNVQYGVISHTNTKHSAILNQRYFINEMRNVTFRSINTLNEFKTFVRYPNGTWKAKGGEHDDRVMAFVWALMILFNEITEIYFEIDELDDYGKPLKISPYDHGIKYFENATSIYTNEQVDRIENSNLSPMAFGAFGEGDDEMAGLLADGWQSLNGGMPHVDPSRSMSQESYDAMNRWFT
jgi:intein/homing endonuclease